jgi:hypothetical protein
LSRLWQVILYDPLCVCCTLWMMIVFCKVSLFLEFRNRTGTTSEESWCADIRECWDVSNLWLQSLSKVSAYLLVPEQNCNFIISVKTHTMFESGPLYN